MTDQSKEVSPTQSGAVTNVEDYGDMRGMGMEDVSMKDLSIPFWNVLQAMSPEVTDQTVEGAKAGDLLNSVTREIIQQPVVIIPLFRDAAIMEWAPRSSGGGLIERHPFDCEMYLDCIKQNGGSRVPPKDPEGKRQPFKSIRGNDLIETFYMYVAGLTENGQELVDFGCLAFSSTKIAVFKRWLTNMQMKAKGAPIFANRCKLSTVSVKNNLGTFYNYEVSSFNGNWTDSLLKPSIPAEKAILEEAKKMYDAINEGSLEAKFETMDTGQDTIVDTDGAPIGEGADGKTADGTEMPF